MSVKTKCPVDGCEVMKPRYRLMCPRHWRLVPDLLQREVWTYYRNQNWPEWRRSADRAIAAVNANPNSVQRSPEQGELKI